MPEQVGKSSRGRCGYMDRTTVGPFPCPKPPIDQPCDINKKWVGAATLQHCFILRQRAYETEHKSSDLCPVAKAFAGSRSSCFIRQVHRSLAHALGKLRTHVA